MSTPLNRPANHKPPFVAVANRIGGKLIRAADSPHATAGRTGYNQQ
jgi:hypothetical protein